MKKIFTLFAAMLFAVVMNAAIDAGENALSAAISGANPGDVIELNTGDFTETAVFDIAQDITIKAADGEVPVVKPKGIGIKSGANVIFDGVKIDCSAATDHVIYANDDSDDKSFTLEGCEVYGFTNNSSVIYTEQKFDTCIISNSVLRNIEKSIIFYNGGSGKYVSITNSTLANITPTNESSYWTAVIYPATATKVRIDHCTFYNCLSMGSYGVINLSAADVVVSNSIFALPADNSSKKAINNSGGYVMNCLTHHFTRNGSGYSYGIATGATISGCEALGNVDPQFTSTASNNFKLLETSPAYEAGVGGTHLGDSNNWPDSWQPAADIPVDSIALNLSSMGIEVNEKASLFATVLPNNATDPSVTWTSSNDAIATVAGGLVTGIAVGDATITATAGTKSATCVVTVSAASIPSSNFASPYFFKGSKAVLEGDILYTLADSLTYPDKQIKGIASWKINALNGGVMQATANFHTGNTSGAKLQIVILDSIGKQVGDTLKQDYYDEDGDVDFPGSILLPKEGVYTVKLLNAQTWSHSKINGITLTKTADVPSIQVKGGWDSWLAPRNLTISDDGLSASVTISLAADYDPEFKVLVNGAWRANGWWFNRNTEPTSENLDTDGDNMKIVTDWDGDYTITWMLQTNTLGITFPAVPDPVFYVAGTFTDWETNKVAMTEEAGICTASITLDANTDTYAYKILKIDAWGTKTWYGAENEGARMVYGNSTDWQLTTNGGGQNINLTSTLAGEYPFTFYAGTAKMDVEIPNPSGTAIDNTVVGEKAVKLMENGQLVIIKNGVRYNVLGTVIK